MALEPNDVISNATETGITFDTPTNYYDYDNINSYSDVDLYKIQADAGDRLLVDIDAQTFGSPLDSYLRVFNSAGVEVAAADGDGSSYVDALLSFSVSTSDTYYIGVSGSYNSYYDPNVANSGYGYSTGDYSVRIAVAAPQTITGTSGDDYLYGDVANDSISGLAGNDYLYGDAGDDTLNGGAGNDTLVGGTDNDSLLGGAGADRLKGDVGNDTLRGADGNDTLFGGANEDSLFGGAGSDRLFGEGGSDNLNGGIGNDSLNGGAGSDTVLGGAGDDTITGGSGGNEFVSDSLVGGAGNDRITANNGYDTLEGGDGNDRLTAGNGYDTLNGGAGNDTLVGVSTSGLGRYEQDTLTGGAGADTFALGNASSAFYYDNDSSSGDYSYGLITDFNASLDVLQLKGFASQYSLEFSTNGGVTSAEITYDPGVSGVEELIGIVQNVSTNFSLTASYVSYA
jgi:Ca2+-binding RTX toxin-like protein